MGGLRSMRGDWTGGLRHFDEAVRIRPDDADARENRERALLGVKDRAIALAREHRYLDALPLFDLAHDAEPDNPETLNNRGNTLMGLGHLEEALDDFNRAIELRANYVDALANRSALFVRLGRYEEALIDIEPMLRIAPDRVMVHHNYGLALGALGRHAEALEAYERALKLSPGEPETIYNRGTIRMLTGDYKNGWRDFEMRWRHPEFQKPRPLNATLWLGQMPLQGKRILIHAEQGQGDTVQYARYIPRLAAEAAEVIFEVQPGLVRLFKSLNCPATIVAQGLPLPPFDLHCPTQSLPLALGIDTPEAITAPRSYLSADPADIALWRERLGPKKKRLRIGISWAGNPLHRNDRARSMPQALLRSLEGPDVEIVVLQLEARKDLRDFADTAALIQCLDLVVVVDTAIAHVAGALGVPVWMMVASVPDWRWMLKRTDTPWYATMRLYRQSRPGDWSDAVERVRADLVNLKPRNASSAVTATPAKKTMRDAFAAFAARNFEEADRICRDILAARPDDFDAHHLMGGLRAHATDWQGAMRHFDKAVSLQPNNTDARSNRTKAIGGLLDRGITLARDRYFDAALEHFDIVIASEPNLAAAWNNRGNALYEIRRYDEALDAYDRALALDDKLVMAHSNRGNILSRYGRFEESFAECDKVLSLAPNEAAAHHNRANALRALRRYDEALVSYGRAIELQPDLGEAHVNRAMLRLQLGDFARGAAEFDWRWKVASYPKMREFAAPRWSGREAIAGKRLLVHGEQGQGDVIQFARFTKLLAERGARAILEAPTSCVRLFESLEGAPEILPFGDPLPVADYQIPIMSLIGALGLKPETIPAPRRYLNPPPDVSAEWHAKMGTSNKTRVGVVWAGNPAHHNDYLRSMPRALLESLAGPKVEIVPLQKELRDDLVDFADTAALIDCLDLVITVDTSVAHLAGALGAETWVLIPYAPDWRWMNDRTDSPWYPSVTLYRQSAPRDWEGVIERIRAKLSRIAGRGAR